MVSFTLDGEGAWRQGRPTSGGPSEGPHAVLDRQGRGGSTRGGVARTWTENDRRPRRPCAVATPGRQGRRAAGPWVRHVRCMLGVDPDGLLRSQGVLSSNTAGSHLEPWTL
nr:hypothetical protein CFP56_79246 [Quercus suber]